MGKHREAPEMEQLSLFPERNHSLTGEVVPPGRERFLAGRPERLFIGEISLRQYLEDAGKGWVIRFRQRLFEQDATTFFEKYRSTGRKPYHPFIILGLILYGIQLGRWSLRELEDLAKLDLGAWWICGGLQPDHSTIGDFINQHADVLTEEFFVQLTSGLVKRLGISSGTVAGDGTVIEAASSHFKMLKREATERELQKAEKETGRSSERTKKLRTALEAVTTRDAQRKRKGRGKHPAKVCPDEPEAPLQPRKDKVYRPSYKPSILADKNRLIVGQHVHPNSEMASVKPLLDQYQNVFGTLPKASLWDGNYNTFELLELSISMDMDVICGVAPGKAPRSKKQIPKTDFTYDEIKDEYECPQGQKLKYRKSGQMNGRPYREYQCQVCGVCKQRTKCTKSKQGRSIIRYDAEELKEAMQEVLKQPAAKKLLKRRKVLVEPPFSELQYRQGLRRFRRKGLEKVRVEASLHCIAYNLRRAIRLEEADNHVGVAIVSAYVNENGLNRLQIGIICPRIGLFVIVSKSLFITFLVRV
jgi:transposase